jgi:hypothetical protein
MSNTPQPRSGVNGRPPPQPVRGTFRWVMKPGPNRPGCLLINGKPYLLLELLDGLVRVGVRLLKEDGENYDLDTRAEPWQCECPDFQFRRDGRDPNGCKHVAALRLALPLLSAPPAATEKPTD